MQKPELQLAPCRYEHELMTERPAALSLWPVNVRCAKALETRSPKEIAAVGAADAYGRTLADKVEMMREQGYEFDRILRRKQRTIQTLDKNTDFGEREHRVPAAPARRRAAAGLGTARRPAAAGGDDRRGNPLPGHVVDHKGRKRWTERSLEERLRNAMFPSAGWSRPRSYGVRRSAMIEARSSCRSRWPAGPASRRTARRRATARPDSCPASRPPRPPRECPRPWRSRRS